MDHQASPDEKRAGALPTERCRLVWSCAMVVQEPEVSVRYTLTIKSSLAGSLAAASTSLQRFHHFDYEISAPRAQLKIEFCKVNSRIGHPLRRAVTVRPTATPRAVRAALLWLAELWNQENVPAVMVREAEFGQRVRE